MDLQTAYDAAQGSAEVKIRALLKTIWDEALRIARPETGEDAELLALVLRDTLKSTVDEALRLQMTDWIRDEVCTVRRRT